MNEKKRKNKPGQGRKPLAPERRRVRLSIMIAPETDLFLWNYCELHNLSAGEFIDKLVENFTAPIPGIHGILSERIKNE